VENVEQVDVRLHTLRDCLFKIAQASARMYRNSPLHHHLAPLEVPGTGAETAGTGLMLGRAIFNVAVRLTAPL
jgi:hypothetical protein